MNLPTLLKFQSAFNSYNLLGTSMIQFFLTKPTYRWRKWGKEESEDLNLHHLTLKAELFILHYRYETSTCVFDSYIAIPKKIQKKYQHKQ